MNDGINTTHPLYARLRQTAPFARLPERQFASLMESARWQQAGPGEWLVREADGECDCLVLAAGELEVLRRVRTVAGVEEIEHARLAPDAGELAVLHALPRRASVRAVTATQVLRLDGEQLEELLAWSQRFAGELNDLDALRARMNLVRRAGPFRRLPLERVRMAFECMQPVEIERGAQAVREGEKGDCYYVIERGFAEVWRSDPMTGDTACVAALGPGDAFGEEALLPGGFGTASVVFTAPGRLWALSKEHFDTLLRAQLVHELDAAAAHAEVARGAARWLDCRYDVEFEEARLPGALHVPLDRLRERAAVLDVQTTWIVYCRSGRRSACAAYLLRERGHKAYSLIGGLRDWPYALDGAAAPAGV
jgi:CRP-like cAMP-binding protein